MIGENLEEVRDRIRQTALRSGRNPEEIRLVCVTKTAGVQTIKELIRLGITDIGENRVQDAQEKIAQIPDKDIKWHMVGHLQRNKVKYAVGLFDMIHSVDSLGLAEELDRQVSLRGAKSKTQLDVLLQINTSGEETKFGIEPEGVFDLIKEISKLNNIRIKGLMTITPIVKYPEEARQFFRKLKELKEEIILKYKEVDMNYLSMGMSQDFEVAIEEGANILRIGTAILGKSEEPK